MNVRNLILEGMYKKYIKRYLDIILSLVGLLIGIIPMGIMAVIIFIEDPASPVFTQKRIGKNRKYFKLYKFRTMRKDAPRDIPTHLFKDADRYLLKCGRIFRKTSLDELPQLFNILKGDMSLIGPRPALWNQDDLMVEREKYGANSVLPGLTGWAQVNGRDELSIPDKAKLDGEYVKKLSFRMDLKCFLKTIGNVIKCKDVVEGSKKVK